MNESTPTPTPAVATNIATTFNAVIMKINERKGGKTVFKKFLELGLPTLEQVLDSLPAPDSWEKVEVTEEGQTVSIDSPVYEDDTLQYLQDALTQRIQGLARSRDAAGQAPCTTWQEVAESGSGTKYPIQLRDFREAFAAWMEENTELTEKQQAALLAFTDAKRLMLQDDHKKERVALFLGEFVESLGDSASEVASVINALNRALETTPEDVDF